MYLEIGSAALPNVLLVDDEADIAEALADTLRRDFHVIATTSPEEALARLRLGGISTIVADQRMPGMTGAELLAQSAAISPDTVRILLTGFADIDAVIDAVNDGGISHYVTKPWRVDAFVALVRAAAGQYAVRAENHKLVTELARMTTHANTAQTGLAAAEERQSVMADENETLRTAVQRFHDTHWHLERFQEFLPMCMECGRVKGDAGWEPVVDYLRKNSLFLSHGYCPDCAKAALSAAGVAPEALHA